MARAMKWIVKKVSESEEKPEYKIGRRGSHRGKEKGSQSWWNKGCKGWYETPYGSWGWNDWKSHPNKGKSEKGSHRPKALEWRVKKQSESSTLQSEVHGQQQENPSENPVLLGSSSRDIPVQKHRDVPVHVPAEKPVEDAPAQVVEQMIAGEEPVQANDEGDAGTEESKTKGAPAVNYEEDAPEELQSTQDFFDFEEMEKSADVTDGELDHDDGAESDLEAGDDDEEATSFWALMRTSAPIFCMPAMNDFYMANDEGDAGAEDWW